MSQKSPAQNASVLELIGENKEIHDALCNLNVSLRTVEPSSAFTRGEAARNRFYYTFALIFAVQKNLALPSSVVHVSFNNQDCLEKVYVFKRANELGFQQMRDWALFGFDLAIRNSQTLAVEFAYEAEMAPVTKKCSSRDSLFLENSLGVPPALYDLEKLLHVPCKLRLFMCRATDQKDWSQTIMGLIQERFIAAKGRLVAEGDEFVIVLLITNRESCYIGRFVWSSGVRWSPLLPLDTKYQGPRL